MTIPTGETPHPPPAAWLAKFKRELEKLETSYWVIRQPINPKDYERVVTDIHLQCQEIFNQLGYLDTENAAHLLNYISDKNQQIIRRIETLKSGSPNKAPYDSGIEKLQVLEKRVMDVALDLAVAHEDSQSLSGRAKQAASTGLEILVGITLGIPIVAATTIDMTNTAITTGVNHLAAQYLPVAIRKFSPEQLLQGRHPDMRSFAMAVLSKVTEKKVAALPVIGDSRKIHRVVEKGARKVTSFEDKIFAPLQQKLLLLAAAGNFQQLLGRALIATARTIELIQAAEQQPGDMALRKEFLIRRLLPGASSDNYAKRMDRQSEALLKKFMGGSEEMNLAAKVVKELMIRFSRVSGLTNLIIASTVETLTQTPQPAKVAEPQFGQTLAELHRSMERDYPLAAELLKTTGGWEKMRSLENYADIAALYILNQLLEKAAALVSPSPPPQTASFDSSVHQLIDTVHALVTSDKTWDHYWLRLFSSLPKEQILKRIDWNNLLAEPLRVQWQQWMAGK